LFVIDFDTVDLYQEWHALFASSFDATVSARTRKGFHIYYVRTPLCDELDLGDGPVGSVRDAKVRCIVHYEWYLTISKG